MNIIKRCICAAAALCLILTCGTAVYAAKEESEETPVLKETMTGTLGDDFHIGTAICLNEIDDSRLMELVTTHFNSVTFGNELKPDAIFSYSSVCPGTETVLFRGEELIVPKVNFSRAEAMLEIIKKWNEENPDQKILVRGHVLVWHSQTPEWFFHEDYQADKPYVSAEEMDKRQEWYIKTVAEHFTGEDSPYRGMFYGWDVVNEAVSDSTGTYRNDRENSSWWAVYGNADYIISAFRYANLYMDPSVELYYNDYNEWYSAKKKGILQLIRDVKSAEGTRIDGFGMQGHYDTDGNPSAAEFLAAARDYGKEVDRVQVTELDLKASTAFGKGEISLEEEYSIQTDRYASLYRAYLQAREEGVNLTGMTFWGVIDPNSWLHSFHAVGGASTTISAQAPLLFDGNYRAKPCFYVFADPDDTFEEEEYAIIINHAAKGGGLTGCSEYSVAGGDVTVTFKPSWNEKGIAAKISVNDKDKAEGDRVAFYISVDDGQTLLSAQKDRSECLVSGSGYDAVLFIPVDPDYLQEGQKILIEIVIGNNNEVFTFSGRPADREGSEGMTAAYLQANSGS